MAPHVSGCAHGQEQVSARSRSLWTEITPVPGVIRRMGFTVTETVSSQAAVAIGFNGFYRMVKVLRDGHRVRV